VNRVISSIILVLGLATMMIGVYAEQWNTIQDLVVKFVPLFP